MVAAVSTRGPSELPFEGSVESSFGLISDIARNFRDASRCLFKRPRGQLQPPARQVRHRWFREIAGEPLHQSGPRNANFIRETRDRPRMGDAAMHQT